MRRSTVRLLFATSMVVLAVGNLRSQDLSALSQAKALSQAFREAAESATPAVVTVRAQAIPQDNYQTEYIIRPDGTILAPVNPRRSSDELEDISVGSGVIINASGLVLTNSHVIEGADRIAIELADGQELYAGEVKRDAASDVAMMWIKNPPENLPVAQLGDSDQLETGDWVMAIGSPFELEATVSAGIISGKGRGISKIKRGKLLQTDAAINPGNSGGPLVNLEGQVIGINTAIASNSGGYQGIGFAIPINHAQWVVSQLHEYGEVRRSFLGVDIETLTSKRSASLGLATKVGVYVKNVKPGTPADKAGIQAGDVIVEFANKPVRDSRDLQNVVERQSIGDKHVVDVIRDGTRTSVEVVLELMPDRVKNRLQGGQH